MVAVRWWYKGDGGGNGNARHHHHNRLDHVHRREELADMLEEEFLELLQTHRGSPRIAMVIIIN